jgi:hypothetical protein
METDRDRRGLSQNRGILHLRCDRPQCSPSGLIHTPELAEGGPNWHRPRLMVAEAREPVGGR